MIIVNHHNTKEQSDLIRVLIIDPRTKSVEAVRLSGMRDLAEHIEKEYIDNDSKQLPIKVDVMNGEMAFIYNPIAASNKENKGFTFEGSDKDFNSTLIIAAWKGGVDGGIADLDIPENVLSKHIVWKG